MTPSPVATGASVSFGTGKAVRGSSGILLALFLATMIIPISLDLAGQRLSPYRILLLVLFLPFFLHLLSGRAGRLNLVDAGMGGFALWMIVTLVYHHGAERLPYAVILAVEMVGGYMTGRILIRSVADYHRFIRYFLVLLLVLAPFAVYELFYSRMLIADLLRAFFDVTKKNQEFRFGLARVQAVFPHSILYGLFCSLAFASVYYIYRRKMLQMLPLLGFVTAMTLMSLSSAPMLSILLQTTMILWDKITRSSWKLLAVLTGMAYVFLQVFSNRGAVVIFIETMTLDPQTGWWRIHIWRHGSASVLAHPLMGIGLNDWVRPEWLTGSVDNFWLLMAMRHGLPGLILLLIAIATHARMIVKARPRSPEVQAARTGYMVTFAGLIFILATVHVWNELAVFVMFFLGAGSFFYTGSTEESPAANTMPEAPAPGRRSAMPFSRFSPKPGLARPGVNQAAGRPPR